MEKGDCPVASSVFYEVGFREYLNVLMRRLWLVGICVGLSVICAYVLAYHILTPEYEAQTRISVEDHSPVGAGEPVFSFHKRLGEIRRLLLSNKVLDEIVHEIIHGVRDESGAILVKALPKDHRFRTSPNTLKSSIHSGISINFSGPELIVKYVSSDPQEAEKIVNMVFTKFCAKNEQLSEQKRESNISFISMQIKRYESDIRRLQESMRDFERLNIEIGALSQSYNSEITNELVLSTKSMSQQMSDLIDARKLAAQVKMSLDEAKISKSDASVRIMRTDKFIIETEEILRPAVKRRVAEKKTNVALLAATRERDNAVAALNRERMMKTDRHPTVKKLSALARLAQNRLNQLEENQIDIKIESVPVFVEEPTTIKREKSSRNPEWMRLQTEQARSESSIKKLTSKLIYLEKMIKRLTAEVREMPDKEAYHAKLKKEISIKQGILDGFRNKLEQYRLRKQVDDMQRGMRFQVIDPARANMEPVRPKKKLILIMGLIIGVALAGLSVFFVEYADHSFAEIGDIQRFIDLPVLGQVPHEKYTRIEGRRIRSSRRRLNLPAESDVVYNDADTTQQQRGKRILAFLVVMIILVLLAMAMLFIFGGDSTEQNSAESTIDSGLSEGFNDDEKTEVTQ